MQYTVRGAYSKSKHILLKTLLHDSLALPLPLVLALAPARHRAHNHISVKSTGHFRSVFEPIVGSIYNVDTESLLPQGCTKVGFARLKRTLYPLNLAAVFEPMVAVVEARL